MKKWLVILVALVMPMMMTAPVLADDWNKACTNNNASADVKAAAGCNTGTVDSGKALDRVNTILIIVLSFVGIAAAIMIVVGGLTMATSRGEPGRVARGRNMIIYSVVGLVVAAAAFGIVTFVIGQV